MDEEQTEVPGEKAEPVKRSFILNKDNPPVYEQKSGGKLSGRKLALAVVVLLVLGGGYFAINGFKLFSGTEEAQPAPAATSMPTSIPTPQPVLDRSEWSLEILNGSGVTGAAKKTAEKIQALGYPIFTTGNADKNNYQVTEILVKNSLSDKVELVIADLKEVIKIASVAGELEDSTASARIIIGKDAI